MYCCACYHEIRYVLNVIVTITTQHMVFTRSDLQREAAERWSSPSADRQHIRGFVLSCKTHALQIL